MSKQNLKTYCSGMFGIYRDGKYVLGA